VDEGAGVSIGMMTPDKEFGPAWAFRLSLQSRRVSEYW
jgi:hypothetical protein